MEVQNFFYWVASIALILVGLFTITLFAFLFYIKKLADKTAHRIVSRIDDMSDQVSTVGRAWRNLTLTRFLLRALKYIF